MLAGSSSTGLSTSKCRTTFCFSVSEDAGPAAIVRRSTTSEQSAMPYWESAIVVAASFDSGADDRAEAVERRLQVLRARRRRLIDYYSARDVLRTVDGNHAADQVTELLLAAVNEMRRT